VSEFRSGIPWGTTPNDAGEGTPQRRTSVRSATTLGIVGAGGIGQTLYESIRSFQYAETAAQVIIVVATVVAIDMLSARIRKHLV
jgi:phosphonate transport system permease protein